MNNRWQRFKDWWSLVRVMGAVSLVLGLLGTFEAKATYARFIGTGLASLHTTISSELIGIGVTVLLIDWANERREAAREKARLIREMGNKDNGTALRAVEELLSRGWLEDGSLRNADLRMANLQGARLPRVDLRGADLHEANLNGTYLVGANLEGARRLILVRLVRACALQYATLPDGSRYDGRLRLQHDMGWAHETGVDTGDPAAMAAFYDVSLEQYLRGQEWAEQNLEQVVEENQDLQMELAADGVKHLR